MFSALLGLAACDPAATEVAPTFSILAEGLADGPLLAAWSDGDTALLVGGPPGSGPGWIARWDGARLCAESAVAERTLWWIHGPRAGEWWAVGEGGLVLHDVDGARTREDLPTDATLYGVWATDDEVRAVGGRFDASGGTGEVWVRRDGAWTAMATGLPAVPFKVWEDWIVGDGRAWRIDGDALAEVDAGGVRLLTARGRADDDVWAVGGMAGPEIRRWDGSAWTEVDPGPLGQPLAGVWTAPGQDVYVAGASGTAAILRGDGWEAPEYAPTAAHFHAAWVHDGTPLWVGGDLYGTGDGSGAVLRHGTETAPVDVTPCDRAARRVPGIAAAHAASRLRAGDPAPDIRALDPRAPDLRGKVAVVNFWASWCAPCMEELPLLDALDARLRPAGAGVVAVSVDREAAAARGVVARLRLRMPVVLDTRGAVAGRFAPAALPSTWLLDADGVVRRVLDGALDAAGVAALEREARALVAAP